MRRVLSIFVIIFIFSIYEPIIKRDNILLRSIWPSLAEEALCDLDLTIPNLLCVMNFYKIKHQEIVLSQAILETGWFKSKNCKENNNLFGLYNSRKNKMFRFEHWSLSVKGYRDMIQYRLKETDTNYYYFLKRIGYAEDPDYNYKLKKIIEREQLKKYFYDPRYKSL